MAGDEQTPVSFEQAAQQYRRRGLVREFYDFLRHNKKWWLAPILVVVLLLGVLIALAGTPAAPFIYTFY